MTPSQQAALEALAGRALTPEQAAQIDALLPDRNDVAIAAIVSVGRKRLQHLLVGPGTVVVAMDPHGGACLDAINALGATNRDVYWGMDPIRSGDFDLGLPSAQAWLDKLGQLLPEYADPLKVLQSLGYTDDPVHYNEVSGALNVAENRDVL